MDHLIIVVKYAMNMQKQIIGLESSIRIMVEQAPRVMPDWMQPGEDIGWVDADDRVEPDMFETLMNLIQDYNADIADCQYYELKGDKAVKIGKDEPVIFGSGNFIMKQFFTAQMKPTLWNKIYKKEIWEGIRFPLGRNHQDFYVNVRFALMPLTYVRTSEAKYYYIIRENSITTTKTSRELREAIYKYDYTMDLALNFASTKHAKRYLTRDAINRLIGRFFYVSVNSDINDQLVYNQYVRRKLGFSLIKYLILAHLPLKTRVSYILLLSNLKSLQIYLHKRLGKSNIYNKYG